VKGLTVRPFEATDTAAAATLLAARHKTARKRLPMLSKALEAPRGWEPLVRGVLGPRSHGVAAHRDGKLVGFLIGEDSLFGPTEMASLWFPPHSISVDNAGHAVAPGEDLTGVYRTLYAHLAERWVARGFFIHRIEVTAGDADVQEAWVSLGFGRHITAAVRDTGPVANARAGLIDIREANTEDIDVVMRLVDTLNRHHATSPMFWPMLPETDEAAKQFNLSGIAGTTNAYFIAYLRGQPAALQSFLAPGFTPQIVEPEKTIYLFDGVVDEAARDGGVGSSLLEHSMRHLREHGYERCCLHFASGNPSGAPFWLGQGFVPVQHTMLRHVDERIAWANHTA
jgi:GNAT superfamily N-acetyltransferase